MPLYKKLYQLMRIKHWTKGLFVFLGVFYAQASLNDWLKAALTAVAFCFVASSIYIYNDLNDLDEDKQHPEKSKRPLARGDVSKRFAKTVFIVCCLIGLSLGWMLSPQVLFFLCIYLVINFFYNFGLRSVPLLDVLCVASGFLLRILAGTLGIGLSISRWLMVTVTLLCLFIALCKRQLEMRMRHHRRVLEWYASHDLKKMIMFTAACCFLSYFFHAVRMPINSLSLLLTLFFCAFGLGRFTQLSIRGADHDDPLRLFWQDRLSRWNVFFFCLLSWVTLL
jgi:4-hydroxybenzoate polyprenyltransferase